MKSFFDDLLEFGSGALDSVGENASWLFPSNDQSTNPDKTQQPNHPVVDDRGNAVDDSQFVGLCIDEDRQPELTDELSANRYKLL